MKRLKIGLIAESEEAKLYYDIYKESPHYELCGVTSSKKELLEKLGIPLNYEQFDSLFYQHYPEAISIISKPEANYKYIEKAINTGRHLLVHFPLTFDLNTAEKTTYAMQKNKIKLQISVPFLFYPPIQEVKRLINENKIGEISALRIKSNICGSNLHKINSEELERIILTDIYEKFAFAYFYLGDIEKVFSYKADINNPHSPIIIIWKYKEPGKYGVLEIVLSPDMQIQTLYHPVWERIEISGTKGIIWITPPISKAQNVPPVFIYYKDRTLTLGNIRDRWLDAYHDSNIHFYEWVTNKKKPIFTVEEYGKILQFTLSVKKSWENRTEIKV